MATAPAHALARPVRLPRSLLPIALIALAAGCVGSIRGGEPGPASTPAEPAPTGATPPPGGPACRAAAPWRTTLLTRDQYVNTLSELLGFDVRPQVKFADAGGRTAGVGVAVTALQAEERLRTAEAIAAAAASPANLTGVLGCDPAVEAACADRFVERFGSAAFRHPLDAGTRSGLRQLYEGGRAAGGVAGGVEWVVSAVLQSVEFLYHLAPPPASAAPGSVAPLEPPALAERLSYFLWDSGPDDGLAAAAMSGHLATAAEVEAQVRRMLADPRAARARAGFYRDWLELDNLASLTRADAAFTPALAGALAASALAGIDDVYRSGASSRALFDGSTLFLDDTLASVYAPAQASGRGSSLAPLAFDRGQRRGLLTHPALLTVFAEADASDPIRRGKFIATRLFCQDLPPPADDVPVLPPLRDGLSVRQRLEQHRMSPACNVCHRLFDPVGLAFERYDHLGRFRAQDHGVAVDTSGAVVDGLQELSGPFADGMELVDRIADSPLVRRCLAGQWYAYALGGDPVPSDACAVDAVKARFAGKGDLSDLLVAIATAESFRNRLVEE